MYVGDTFGVFNICLNVPWDSTATCLIPSVPKIGYIHLGLKPLSMFIPSKPTMYSYLYYSIVLASFTLVLPIVLNLTGPFPRPRLWPRLRAPHNGDHLLLSSKALGPWLLGPCWLVFPPSTWLLVAWSLGPWPTLSHLGIRLPVTSHPPVTPVAYCVPKPP